MIINLMTEDEFLKDFVVDMEYHLESLRNDLVALTIGTDNPDHLDRISQTLRKIERTSDLLGYPQLTSVAATMTEVIDEWRKGKSELPPSLPTVISQSVDHIRIVVSEIKRSGVEHTDSRAVINRLRELKKHIALVLAP
ncbi:MAG: hypothetical protein HY232_18345 [Acidobacteria bacterium]|nr:hypothetical protein [Acidobacteriota bacterium]